ncbi:MAG: sensor histidine kinase [Anaerolineae bacterium]
MKRDTLEPGLLNVLGLYFQARLAIVLVSAGVYVFEYGLTAEPSLAPYVVLFLADLLCLASLTYWTWLQQRLGRAYLPVTLVLATAIPIVEGRFLYGLYAFTSSSGLWLVFPFLSIPLILVAWQYHYREVVIFSWSTTLFELAVLMFVPAPGASHVLLQAWYILPRTVFFLLAGYTVTNLVETQRRQREELAEANTALVRHSETVEELGMSRERNRLARELHDTVAHTLSGLTVELEAIATLWQPNPERARAMLDRALVAARGGLEETRRALQDLRATPIEDLGLALAIRNLAESAAGRASLALRLDVPEQVDAPAPEVEQCYYRVAQEALENVVRHAEARRVSVSLRRTRQELVLEVGDDGRGFGAGTDASEERFGLRGMRERADSIGATLEVTSQPDQGTTVRLRRGVLP